MENREAIRYINAYIAVNKELDEKEKEAFTIAISALEKQEQSCDTCKHGQFWNPVCSNCCAIFPSHYEAEEES